MFLKFKNLALGIISYCLDLSILPAFSSYTSKESCVEHPWGGCGREDRLYSERCPCLLPLKLDLTILTCIIYFCADNISQRPTGKCSSLSSTVGTGCEAWRQDGILSWIPLGWGCVFCSFGAWDVINRINVFLMAWQRISWLVPESCRTVGDKSKVLFCGTRIILSI